MLSLSYHIVYDDAVQKQFRDDWIGVAAQFSISEDAKKAIATATSHGVYSEDDAKAICAFMCKSVEGDLQAASSSGAGSSNAPPFGMLSAVYHTFAARDGIPLERFDLTQEERNAITGKTLSALEKLMFDDFNRRYEDIYELAW